MLGKSPEQNQPQSHIFKPLLSSFIDMGHELVRLGQKFEWDRLEASFSVYYPRTGTPSKPIRLMSGLLMLKHMFNHSDETLVEVWKQNPYYQYFTGSVHFQWGLPCDASDLVHFRKRIGGQGVLEIFRMSVGLHSDKVANAKDVLVDTTVEEKNITFPTDTKLAVKIIAKCWKLAEMGGIKLRQSYRRKVKGELAKCRFAHHPKRKKEGFRAMKRIRAMAKRIVRDIDRKATQAGKTFFEPHKELFSKVLNQKKDDRDKTYSLHGPQTACIAKGKAHKQYEFGSKIGIATLPGSNVIVGVSHFRGNPHDSTTLEPTLKAAEEATGKTFNNAIVDRGYKGKSKVGGTTVVIPNPRKDLGLTPYQKSKKRKMCRSRAAIEPVIGHVKHDHRMARNFLKGEIGDKVNAILAAAAFNLKKALNELLLWLQFFQTILIWVIGGKLNGHSNRTTWTGNVSC
jgi:transposase, IS5 family